MSSSLVEAARMMHRDIDAQKEAIIKLLSKPAKKTKDELRKEYEINARISVLKRCMKKLNEYYLDKDKIRAYELSDLTEDGFMQRFYDEFDRIKEFHQKQGVKALRGSEVAAVEVNAHEELRFRINFSQTEKMGKCIDVYSLYQEFISLAIFRSKLKGGFDVPPSVTILSHMQSRILNENADGGENESQASHRAAPNTMTMQDELNPLLPSTKDNEKQMEESEDRIISLSSDNTTQENGSKPLVAYEAQPIDYLVFLSLLGYGPLLITKDDKLSAPRDALEEYRKYLGRVGEYLRGYMNRLHPLVDTKQLDDMCVSDFNQRYSSNKLVGWNDDMDQPDQKQSNNQTEGEEKTSSDNYINQHSEFAAKADRPQPTHSLPTTYASFMTNLNNIRRVIENAEVEAGKNKGKGQNKGKDQNEGKMQHKENNVKAEANNPENMQDASSKIEQQAASTSPASSPSLYCEVCQHQFSNEAVYGHHLTGKKHRSKLNKANEVGKETKKELEKKPEQKTNKQQSKNKQNLPLIKDILELEYLIGAYCDLLQIQIVSTRALVEKMYTATYRELVSMKSRDPDHNNLFMDGSAGELYDQDDDSDEDEFADGLDGLDDPNRQGAGTTSVNYNPLNLPLDWDGKPIPYWLYKLHGLNIQYDCEICCGFTYRGPRDFYKHFNEWRHQYAMKQLGIPNTQHFMYITKVDDAKALLKRLETESSSKEFNQLLEEEIEME